MTRSLRVCILLAAIFASAGAESTEAAGKPEGAQALEKEWIGVFSPSSHYIALRLKITVGAAVVQDGHREPAYWITGTMEHLHFEEVASAGARRRNKTPPTVLSSEEIKGHYRPLSRTLAFMSPQQWDYDEFNRGRMSAILGDDTLVFGLAGPARTVQGVAMHAGRTEELVKAVSNGAAIPQPDQTRVRACADVQVQWWKNWIGQRLDSLVPGADADRQIAAVHEWIGSVLGRDRASYDLLVSKAAAAKQRVIGSSAELAIIELENVPPGQQTLDLAEAWQNRYSASTSANDSANYLRLVERSAKAVDRALEAVLAAETMQPVEGLAPVAAVEAGTRDYLRLRSKYGYLSAREGFRQYFRRSRAARDAAFAAGRDEFLDRIRRAGSSQHLKKQLDEWLAVPGDTETTVGRELSRLGVDAVARLEWQEKLAMYSRHEQRWLQRDGTLAIPPNAGPPDADDITVALLRAYALHGGKREKPRATIYQPGHMKLFGTQLEFSLRDVRVTRIGRMENGNYAVDFDAALNIDYRSDPATAEQMRQGSYVLLAQVFDQVNASPAAARTGEFMLTPEGWRSPTEEQLMQEGADAVLRMASSLIDNLRRRIFGPRTVIVYP